MKRKPYFWSAAAVLGAVAMLSGACVPDGPGTTSTTTTTVPDDPNGRYVALSGTDAGDCAASATPCATIQYATDQAVSGDTVYVDDGAYPEMVSVAKDLTYKGANAGIKAGVNTGARGAESIVQGFRNPGNPGTDAYDVTIDGFQIDPQGDAGLISASASPLVWLRGGPTLVSVTNNVFNGGPFVPDCSFTCTTMADYAFVVQSGTVIFADNTVANFRRAVNINQRPAAPDTNAIVSDNAFTGVTSRAMSLSGSTGVQMPGQVVTGNTVDATGITAASTPAGMTVSNGNNTISDNTFTGLSSGIFIDLCKKFITDNNSITDNTFDGNAAGVNMTPSQGGQCTASNTEGTGGWVVGGGRVNGLVINGNNFQGNTSYAIRHAAYNWDYWNATAPALTTGPIDVSCNWWNSASGPAAVVVHAFSDPAFAAVPDQLVYSPSPYAALDHSPWLTAPAPGGACDGV